MAGRVGDRPDQLLAGDARPAGSGPSSSVRATVETATQGRRSSGVASSAASLTRPTGRPLPVTVTMAAGLGLARAADGLGERQVVGDGEGTAGQVAGDQGGSRRRSRGRRDRGGGAGPEEAAR